jgi:hypothetical protein
MGAAMLKYEIEELQRMTRSLASPLRKHFYAKLLMSLELAEATHQAEIAARDDRIRELEKQLAAA